MLLPAPVRILTALVVLFAFAIWQARPDVTSDLVKGLATSFLGLVLPIAGSFFSIPRP